MRQLSFSVRQIIIAACCLVSLGLTSLLFSPVSALGTVWLHDISDVEPFQQLTGLDGSVAVFNGGGCTAGGDGPPPFEAKIFNRDGALKAAIPTAAEGESLSFCSENKAIDASGILYGTHTTGAPGNTEIVAYDGETKLWGKQITDPAACNGEPIDHFMYEHMIIGTDGYLYVLSEEDDGCSGTHHFLSKLRASDGQVLFNKDIGNYGGQLYAYDRGVVLFSSQEELRYFNHDGIETATVEVEPEGRHNLLAKASTMDGRVYFDVIQERTRDSTCDDNRVSSRVVAYGSDGKVFEHELPPCENVISLAATHEHNLAFTTTSVNFGSDRFVKIAGDGTIIENKMLPLEEGGYQFEVKRSSLHSNIIADTNGNILFGRNFERIDDRRIGMKFTLSEGDSDTVLTDFSTDTLNADKGMSVSFTDSGMASGRLYVIATHCGFPDQCYSGDPEYIYALDIPELGMDYPRGAVLGAEPAEQAEKMAYLALGDSFVSGEGDLEGDIYYAYGTGGEVVPEEKCHLSTRSYPYLLAQQGSLTSEFFRSVACSGAVTEDIKNDTANYTGQYRQYEPLRPEDRHIPKSEALATFIPGRAAQIEFVKKYKPAVLTIGIGGNDIGFDSKLKSCITSFVTNVLESCSPATTEGKARYRDGAEIQALYGPLKDLYEKLHDASEDTKIYAVGYPNIVTLGTACAKNVHLDDKERLYAVETVKYLNAVVEAAATDAGIGYIDIENSLRGMELCAGAQDDIAVNGITEGDDVLFGTIGKESFHPNQRGHAAIATSIGGRLPNLLSGASYCEGSSQTLCPAGQHQAPSMPSYFSDYEPDSYIKTLYSHTIIDEAILLPERSFNAVTSIFAPGSTLHFEIHSEPVNLGEYVVGSDGKVNVELEIPASVPPGHHELHAIGTTASGEKIDQYEIVLVGALEHDIDGDGVSNESDRCSFIPPANTDKDKDGADDACDPFIDKPPLPGAPIVEVRRPVNRASQTKVIVSGQGDSGTTAVISVNDENSATQPVVGSTELELSATDPVDYSKELDVSPLDDGTLTITATLENESGKSPSSMITVIKDTDSPNTDASTSTAPNSAGWHNSDISVTLNATDQGMGVKQVTYSAAGAHEISTTITADRSSIRIPFTNEGVTTLKYYATDKAGNTEEARTLIVRIDKTGPVTTVGHRDFSVIFGLFGVKLRGEASDNLSGTAQTKVHLKNILTGSHTSLHAACAAGCTESDSHSAWQASIRGLPSGLYTVSAASTDRAGNEGQASAPVRIIVINFTRSWSMAL